MSLEQHNTIDAVSRFLDGTQAVAFSVASDKQGRYRWVQKTLVKHEYLRLGKRDKGIVTRYLMKVTGYSLAQAKRLIGQYTKTGSVTVKAVSRNGFKRTYTERDKYTTNPSRPCLFKINHALLSLFGVFILSPFPYCFFLVKHICNYSNLSDNSHQITNFLFF